MSEFDKLLEQVARRVCLATTGKAEAGDLAAVRFVLRETVLPLLEAGQALTQGYGHSGHWDSTMQYGAGCLRCIEQRKLREAWDKQKQAAMEGRCSTDQK